MKTSAPPLGGLSAEAFMRDHWQRRPRLFRQAFPELRAPVSPQALFELACQDEVESRLVTGSGMRRQLARGPFDADALPVTRRRPWTLLVQGMDLHDDAVHALMARFRFIPDARLDDLMISYAVDGGGVGPHVDSYDVFLIQAHGRRRWRIAPPGDETLVEGAPLKLLANFAPTEDWVLEPGDMLYLPPHWGHDGVALGECMTLSVGFRAPSRHELLSAWLADCADTPPTGPDPRFRDAGAPPTRQPARIPAALDAQLLDWLRDWRPEPARLEDFLGRFLTEPKPGVFFDPPARRMRPEVFAAAAQRRGLRVDRRCRLAYRGSKLFINGETVSVPAAQRPLLRRLADQRTLDGAALTRPSAHALLCETLHDWFDAGWIHLSREVPRTAR